MENKPRVSLEFRKLSFFHKVKDAYQSNDLETLAELDGVLDRLLAINWQPIDKHMFYMLKACCSEKLGNLDASREAKAMARKSMEESKQP